ncbi:MAG: tRNA-dihydrouridine synthase [Caulobacteraceae bacterium]
MTGISDLPFRQTATRLGALYVATEMVACAAFAETRPEVVRRAAIGSGATRMVVQLVGHDPHWLARGARLARAAGARVIDLNFGCPAKSVTGVLCGSALMREPDNARAVVAAVVDAVDVPVTVKMRLGWDDADRNAPELAAVARDAGASAVTVHGRTRSQFYAGAADWLAVREVVEAVDIPVVVNGDIRDAASARTALRQSGAAGVMIGRAATGRPWLAAEVAADLAAEPFASPDRERRLGIVLDHFGASLRFYGDTLGTRAFRKHLAAYIDAAPWPAEAALRREARARLCRMDAPGAIATALIALWTAGESRLAA